VNLALNEMMKAQKERKQAWSAAYREAKEHGGREDTPTESESSYEEEEEGKKLLLPCLPYK
jgi:hypothetical protein